MSTQSATDSPQRSEEETPFVESAPFARSAYEHTHHDASSWDPGVLLDAARVNVVLGGFPKTGTTAMAAWLGESPHVCLTNPKETFLLCPEFDMPPFVASGTKLEDCFHGDAAFRMEATTLNAYSAPLMEAIATRSDIKVILLLRDPVAAVLSWHNQVRQAGDAYDDEFETAWEHAVAVDGGEKPGAAQPRQALKQNYANVCRFGRHCEQWLARLTHDRVLIVDNHELRQGWQQLVPRLEAFLGRPLALDCEPATLNSYASIRFAWIYGWLRTSGINSTLRGLERSVPLLLTIRRAVREKLFRKAVKKERDASLESRLGDYFSDDVALAERLRDENRRHWLV
ncbi:MAG: sulfotransferase domain-containing protein [Planctomycetota bacterium]